MPVKTPPGTESAPLIHECMSRDLIFTADKETLRPKIYRRVYQELLGSTASWKRQFYD